MDAPASHEVDVEQETALLDAVEKWLEREVRPHVLRLDHADEYPFEMVEQMKELGLFGATIAQEYGGLGLSATTYAKIVEKVAETWMSLSGIFNSHLIMAACVQRNGSAEQKNYYLPKFATGEIRGGLALTEPDAGTDLQAIRTRASRSGNGYAINGTKTWISNGIHGTCFAVLVKTDPEAVPRHKGMSCFIAEKALGFTVSKKIEKLGYKGIDSAELIFDNYQIGGDKLVGGEGNGLQTVLGGLELGRINVAARGCGLASAARQTGARASQACEKAAFSQVGGRLRGSADSGVDERHQRADGLRRDDARAGVEIEAGHLVFGGEHALQDRHEALQI